MCGINGIIIKESCQQNYSPIAMVERMNKKIVHRGPDDEGIWSNHTITIGMRRLSIIDLNNGKQPMISHDGTISIVFNGEIYNYQDLKIKLIARGCTFTTNSDTEVILQGYITYGIEIISLLNGMFAFVICDIKKNKCYLVRDRFGEKPLHYYHDEHKFIFASEIKSMQEVLTNSLFINPEAVSCYFTLGNIPAPLSIYRDINKLLPGHYLEVDTTDISFKCHSYWKLSFKNYEINNCSFTHAVEQMKELIYDAVKIRMISEVPLGVHLSGGIDSALVASLMQKYSPFSLKTFTIGFKDSSYDETERALQVAKHIKSDHCSFILTQPDLINELDTLLATYDEPFADSSALPVYAVSKLSKKYITVALTGDGGDEIFAGYNRYLFFNLLSKYRRYVPLFLRKNFFPNIGRVLAPRRDDRGSLSYYISKFLLNSNSTDDLHSFKNMIFLYFTLNEYQSSLIDKRFCSIYVDKYVAKLFSEVINKPVSAAQYTDAHITLEGDMLTKVDRASMLVSLECRAPFLDHRLVEYAFALPGRFHLQGIKKKRLLKEIARPLLPLGHVDKKKKGFGVPIGNWLRKELKSDFIQFVNPEFIISQKLFDLTNISRYVNEHMHQTYDHSFKLWALYCFQKWFIRQNSINI